jgi:hypothetical protein
MINYLKAIESYCSFKGSRIKSPFGRPLSQFTRSGCKELYSLSLSLSLPSSLLPALTGL